MLVETVVAAAVLIATLAGVAQLFVQSARTAMESRRAPIVLAAAESKLEQLLALAWTYDAGGAPLSDRASDTSADPPAPAGGTGLSISPADSLTRASPGYMDYLDASGGSLGTTPVAGVVFARRWLIQPGPSLDVLQLRVCVNRVSGAEPELPPEVCLGTARARR